VLVKQINVCRKIKGSKGAVREIVWFISEATQVSFV